MPIPALLLAATLGAVRVDLPADTLGCSLARLSVQADVDIATTDDRVVRAPAPMVHGTMSVEAALHRLLAGLPARAERLPAGGWRVVAARRRLKPPRPAVPPGKPGAAGDIIVTATKRGATLRHYPGASDVLTPPWTAPGGTADLTLRSAVLAETAFGPGRDKLFVRGIADSAFVGTNQNTTAQYLDDARLTYNTPDPDLPLYDLAQVEVAQGPRGTLYGGGALGGVVRLVTRRPDPARTSLAFQGGLSGTEHGAAGADGAMVVNLPLVRDALGFRALGYWRTDGGYIDVPASGRRDVNRTRVAGGRLALRWQPAGGWTVDLRATGHRTAARDAQWATSGLQRDEAVPQPSRSALLMGDVTAVHGSGAGTLTVVASAGRQRVDETYPVGNSFGDGIDRFRQMADTMLTTAEIRYASGDPDGSGWLGGGVVTRNDAMIARSVAGEATGLDGLTIGRLRERRNEAALFGEVRQRLPWSIVAGAGLRLSAAGADSTAVLRDLTDAPALSSGFHATDRLALGSLSLSARPAAGLFTYARFDQAARPSGVALNIAGASLVRGDRLGTVEVGLRVTRPAFELFLSIGRTRWRDVLADLLQAGVPTKQTIGDARLDAVTASGRWRPASWVQLDAALFANRSHLHNDQIGVAIVTDARLPNVSPFGATLGWTTTGLARAGRATLSTEVRLRYQGRSRLGVGTILDRPQGGTIDSQAELRWGSPEIGWSLRVDNFLGRRGNRFAVGSPFLPALPQSTPQRPFTLRLGFSVATKAVPDA